MEHVLFRIPLNQSWRQRARYRLFSLGDDPGSRNEGQESEAGEERERQCNEESLRSLLWTARAKPPRPLKGTWDVSQRSASGGRQLGHVTSCHLPVLRLPLSAVPGALSPPPFPALLDLTLTRLLQHRSELHSRMWRDWGHSTEQGWALRKLSTVDGRLAELMDWGIVFCWTESSAPRSLHLVSFLPVVSMGLGFYVQIKQLFQCLAHSWSHPWVFHIGTPFFIWFKGSRSYLAFETPNLITKIS